MKAIVHTKYGSPDVLRLMEVERPVPKDDEVLIRVQATTVNRTDCGFLRAEPFFVRVVSGLLRPKATILGSELAGEVEAAGKDVTSFTRGDQVFGLTGMHFGAHAEYVCLPEDAAIAAKPANMDYDEAAAVCDGAMLAIAFIRWAALRAGQRVLVNGASGSIGSAAVQLATYYGAQVTAVGHTGSLDLLRSLGADAVIDYTREDFTDVRSDVRRRLRRGRQELVPQVQQAARRGRGLPLVGAWLPRAESPVGAVDPGDRRQEDQVPDPQSEQEGRVLRQEARRGRQVQGGHR